MKRTAWAAGLSPVVAAVTVGKVSYSKTTSQARATTPFTRSTAMCICRLCFAIRHSRRSRWERQCPDLFRAISHMGEMGVTDPQRAGLSNAHVKCGITSLASRSMLSQSFL